MFSTFPPSAAGQAAAGTPQFQLVTIDNTTVFTPETVETSFGPVSMPALVLNESAGTEVIKLTNKVTFDHPQAGDFPDFRPVIKRAKTHQADLYYSVTSFADAVPLLLWVSDGAGAAAPVDVPGPYAVPLDSEYEEVRAFRDNLNECKLVGGVNKFPAAPSTKSKDSFKSVTCTAGEVLFDNLMRGPNGSALSEMFMLAKADGATTLKATVYSRNGVAVASIEADFEANSEDWFPLATRPDAGWEGFVQTITGAPYAAFPSRMSMKVEIVSTSATSVRGGVFYGGGESSANFDA